MAQLRELIVSGPSRFVGASTFNDDVVLNKGATSYADIIPGETSTHSLGNSTYRWNNLYITNINISDTLTTTKNEASTAANIGDIRVAGGIGVAKNSFFGANIYLGSTTYYVNGTAANLPATTIAGLTVAGNLLPSTSVAYNLGSSSKRWLTLYIGNGAEGTAANTGAVQITGGLSTSGKSFMGSDLVITGDIDIQGQNADRFVKFTHTTSSDTGFDWRLGYLGTDNGDANYFVIQSNSTSATWTDVIRLGLTSFDASFAGNINPRTANTGSIGTSILKWNKMYATIFYGDLNGNASTATALTTSAGSPIQPIYFSNGKPVATTYTLGASVPSGAKFTDTWRGIQNNLTSDSTTDSLSAAQGKILKTLVDGKLEKTTYEYNKELAIGSSGKVCIGKFPCYDSNISVEIKSTTNTTYNGTLIIATQNINTSLGGTYKAVVYGDENKTLTNSIKIEYKSGSNIISVYINLPAWSKNILHIQCVSLRGTPTDIATMVDSIPSTATIVPTNAFIHTHNYAGSASAGGSANSAVKLDSSAGSATHPIYFSNGKPVATTYTLEASVPSGAKFTDTTYEAAGSSLGLVKSGGDVTISSGVITVNDDSHNHVISNIDELQTILDAKMNNSVQLSGNNLNDVTTPGFYYGGGSNNCTNRPSNVDAFGMEVFKTASGYITQILTEGNTNAGCRYIRQYNNSTWSSWIPLAGFSSTPTSGQIIIADGSKGKIKTSGYTIATSVPSGAKFTDTTYSAGTGLSLSGTTFNHSNSVTAGTAQGDASKTLAFGGTFTIPTVTYDAQGHITGKGTTTMTMPANPNTDTKNTAGATDTSNKIFLIGATSQAANPQTYSHDTAFVGTDGCLYSNNTKVSVNGHTHSPNEITDGYTSSPFYINTHPENSPTIIPFINNDIAFLTKRGGSVVIKYDGTIQSDIDISNVFDGSGSYWMVNPTSPKKITTITIELTLHKTFGWNNVIYIDSGSNTWRAKNMKIEVMNTNYKNDGWTTKGSVADYGRSQWKIMTSHTPVGASNDGGGFNKIRFTFSNWNNSTGFRLACLGVINYNSSGIREISLPLDGGTMYGGITPYKDNSYNLGSSSKKYANVYATNFQGNASTATKLGTSTVGSGISPIYLNAGTATASTSTVGSGTQPIYLSSGTITASSSTVGSSTKPVYMSSGTITVCGNSLDASVTGSATTVPKALTSNGKTATTSSGYTYGVAGVTSGNRIYSKWYVNLDNGVTTLTDGMLIEIKIPVAGSSSGCAITIDNGTNFHPVIYGSSSIITTHFSANSKILLMYDSTGTGRVYGTIDGSTATSAASITGVWRVMNLYTDGNTYTSAYCSTSASTAAKTATCSGYYLLSKSQIHVIITTTNTAARALTLNINGQGAKPIYINGTVSSSSNYTLPRGSYLVYYDGTNYYFRTDGAITGNLIGNASTATKLANARTISLSGSVTGSGTFDGSGNLNIETTTNHTHNYAGSSNAGGGAKFLETFYQNSTTNTYGASWNFLAQWINSDRLKFKIINNGTIQNSYPIEVDHAYKLVDSSTSKNASAAPLSIGSGTQPVYFSNGVPVATTYTLGKSVPSNAVFTDTKVTQTSVSVSDYTNWRPLVIGSSNSGTEGFTPSTVTDTTITASTISCQPSSGTIKATIFKGALSGNADTATKCVGSYTGSGGQQNPNYFGTNRIGFLMMNTTVNNNDDFKDWMIMDCYVSNDVGGSVAFGINRQRLGAYIMRSTAERKSWTESAELLHTSNYNSYALPLSGGTMSGNIILPYNQSIIQHQLSEPNYTTSIMWYKGGVSQKKYNPSIGHFNIGDTDGAMILLPYATDSDPWDSPVGLYLSKTKLSYNGKSIQITAGYGTSNPTATNYPVGSVYYKLI